MDDSAENKPVHLVNSYTMPFVRLAQASDIIQNPCLLPVSMPAPSIKSLEDEIRRLQGQTFSQDFQPSEAFLADMRRFFDGIKQMFAVIADGLRPAMQTLIQFVLNHPLPFLYLPPKQMNRLSSQSRRYLAVKQRSQRQHFTVPVHRKKRSSRKMQVLERRKARGLNCYGKHPMWEQMGLKLTRTETREFQDFIAWLHLVYGYYGAIDHMHDFKPYDRACKRIDAKIAKRKKYACYDEEEEETSVVWQPITLTDEKKDWIEQRPLAIQDIIEMFRIPPDMIGETYNR